MTRPIAIVGAIVGIAGLVLQYVILQENLLADGGTVLAAAWRFFGFFTILMNVVVTAILVSAALRPAANGGLNSPRMEAIGASAIVMVMITYHTMLAHLWRPEGAQLAADVLLHTVTPILFALYWFMRPHGALKWNDVLYCLVLPAGYAAYALIRGAFDGWYAYPFLDPSTTETAQLLLNIAGMTAAFAVAAIVLVAIDGALSRRAAATKPA